MEDKFYKNCLIQFTQNYIVLRHLLLCDLPLLAGPCSATVSGLEFISYTKSYSKI